MSYQIRFTHPYRKSISDAPKDDRYKDELAELYIELSEQPFHNPKLQTHQLRGAQRNTFTTDVGGRRSDRRIAWRLINKTIVLLLYGDHSIQNRACRMTLEIEDTADVLKVHEPAFDGGAAEPAYTPRPTVGRCFRMWTDAELSAMGFESDDVAKLRVADSDQDVDDLEGLLGERVMNLYLYQHVEGAAAAERERDAILIANPAEPAPTEEDLDLEAEIQKPAAADEFVALTEAVRETVLHKSIEDWMIYVHPEQVALTHRSFEGPARIHGPSGTGKTVVALHRAAYLARSGKSVLFTSFLASLPPIQEELFRRLAPSSSDSVTFEHVQAHARHILKAAGRSVNAKPKVATRAFEQALDQAQTLDPSLKKRIPSRYIREEIDVVLKPRGVQAVKDYINLDRVGRSTQIEEADRRLIWQVYQQYEARLANAGASDHNDVLFAALKVVTDGDYEATHDCVIVDEAQDMSVLELRLLYSLVGDRPNGLLLVGDGQQSLYAGGMRFQEAGISVEGRSVLLGTNYRNTSQIISAATSLVSPLPFEDGGVRSSDGRRDFTSIRRGTPPLLQGFSDRVSHDEFLLGEVRTLVDAAAEQVGSIAVLVPTNRLVNRYVHLLSENEFEATDLRNYDGRTLNKIKVGTYQRSKGLDFKHVLLPRLDDSSLVTPYYEEDLSADERWDMLRREIFVAMGRARDTLTATWVGVPSQVLIDAGLAEPASPVVIPETANRDLRAESITADVAPAAGEPVHTASTVEQTEPESVPVRPVGRKYSRLVPGGWGTDGVALLPPSLREELIVDHDLLSQIGADSASDLSHSLWRRIDANAMPEEILDALAAEVSRPGVNLPPGAAGVWPNPEVMKSWPLRTRTANAVGRKVMAEGLEGEEFTISQLMSIRNFGTKSLLDFLCVSEQQQTDESAPFEPDVILLAKIRDAHWSSLVRPGDPRFVSFLSPSFVSAEEAASHLHSKALAGQFTSTERYDYDRLSQLLDAVAEETKRPFDEALQEVILGLANTNEKNHRAVLARFGFASDGPATLAAAGKLAGLTRERIRQLCKRADDFIAEAPLWLPSLDQAHRLLAESAPIPASEARDLVVERGLIRRPVSAPTFLRWLEIAGIEPEVEFKRGQLQRVGVADYQSDLVRVLNKLARPFGFLNLEIAKEELALQQIPVADDEIVAAVTAAGGWRLNEGWLWLQTPGPTSTHPVISHAQKVRASAGRPFRPVHLRHALKRRAAFLTSSHGADVHVPTTEAISNFCRSHPELTVDDHYLVDVDIPSDITEVLSDTEIAIKRAIDAAPGKVLTRNDLIEQCVNAGVKDGTASQYLTYGPIALCPQQNSWTTVGQDYDLDVANIQPSPRKRTSDCRWAGDDTVVLRSPIRSTTSLVLYFPVEFHPFVADKKFEALDTAERNVGTVAVGENGQSWGFGPFLRRYGAEAGDVLLVQLNLETGTATLKLEESEITAESNGGDNPPAPAPSRDKPVVEAVPGTSESRTPKLEGDALRAVQHRGSHMQIIAAAGSGKTEVVSQRVTDLLAEGVDPATIVAFTFTERAATELKERIEIRVEERLGRSALDRLNGIFIGTIHAYCFRLLQHHVPKYETYDVLDQNQLTAFLSREAKNLGIRELTSDGRLFKSINLFLKSVGVVENELLNPANLPDPFGAVVAAYTDSLDRYRLLSYGQQIQQAVIALEQPEIAERVAGSLQHLIVDEYQDVNPAQERLIELLASHGAQLCVVGDDDQAIYQWRGSDVANIVSFSDRYAPVTSFSIITNRRSRPGIVESANEFAESIPQRLPKSMGSARAAAGDMPPVAVWSADDEEREAGWIADLVLDLAEQGVPYREMAVLVRGRASAKKILDSFASFDIPVQSGGRTGLFDQVEAILLGKTYCWLSSIDWRAPYEAPETIDIDGLIADYQSVFQLDDPHKNRIKNLLSEWQTAARSEKKPVDLVGDLYELLEVLEVSKWDADDPSKVNRLGTLARFTALLADYETVRRRARPDAIVDGEQVGGQDRGVWYHKNLAIHIVNYAQGAYDGFEGEQTQSVNAVDLTTVHGAKGLEWPVVFVPSMTKSRFPSSRTGSQQEWLVPRSDFSASRYEGSDDDERRLFYVAMTRARDWLSVSRHKRVTTRAVGQSPYWDELSDHLTEPHEIKLPEIEQRSTGSEDQLIISFSDLASFLECGHAYRLRSLLGFKPRLAPELGYGKAVHHVLRQVAERTKAGGDVPTTTELADILDSSFFLPTANKPAHREMKQAAQRLIQRYVSDHEVDLHRIWETERPFELHLDGVTVFGRADVILDQEGGSPTGLAIVDYKTSTSDPADHALQLQVYADAGLREGLEMRGAYVHDLSNGADARTQIEIRSEDIEAAENVVTEASERIMSSDFEPAPGDRCRRCEVRTICSSRK